MLDYQVIYLRDRNILILRNVLFDKSKYPCLLALKVVSSPLVVPFSIQREGEVVAEIQYASSEPQETLDEVCGFDAVIKDLSIEEAADEISSSDISEESNPFPTVSLAQQSI
ncbi:hypothetical protein O181_024729 [Austropuccinia psidii MF-1]|uniref:Uncharacterized protein n=1 Tax=Austropuccinia psidii MF-1 TaxID=1389203 RepID=A0A9Q3CJ74_9BASI|nr:hypothetical protein [Austropuccinia psidii MF-1]